MMLARSSVLSLGILVIVASGLGCRSISGCAPDGEISALCASRLVSGFSPPVVSHYAIRAAYAMRSKDRIVLSLQYGSADGGSVVVVLTAYESASMPDVRYGHLGEVNGHQVGFTGQGDETYLAATLVGGVFYQVEVLPAPGVAAKELEAARLSFVESITLPKQGTAVR